MTESIADRLKRRIDEIGTNQKAVAAAADLNETYVRDILTGKSKQPGALRLANVEDALNRMEAGEIPTTGSKGILPVGPAPDGRQPIEDPDELALLGFWRKLDRERRVALLAFIGLGQLPK